MHKRYDDIFVIFDILFVNKYIVCIYYVGHTENSCVSFFCVKTEVSHCPIHTKVFWNATYHEIAMHEDSIIWKICFYGSKLEFFLFFQ